MADGFRPFGETAAGQAENPATGGPYREWSNREQKIEQLRADLAASAEQVRVLREQLTERESEVEWLRFPGDVPPDRAQRIAAARDFEIAVIAAAKDLRERHAAVEYQKEDAETPWGVAALSRAFEAQGNAFDVLVNAVDALAEAEKEV